MKSLAYKSVKSMHRMCNSQAIVGNIPVSVSSGPATEALQKAKTAEGLQRATKRRRSEDSASFECTKVSKQFDMGAIFADLPSNDEAFPTISWDFDDAFGVDSLPTFALPGRSFSAPAPSPSKKFRTESNSSLVRSKSMKSLVSLAELSPPSVLFDLESEVKLARDLGESVLCKKFGKVKTLEPPSKLCDLLKEPAFTGFSLQF